MVIFFLTLARFGNKLRRVRIIGAAHHFTVEHWALATGDALTWAINFAGITIQLVGITIPNVLPMTMVFVTAMESHHLLHLMHLMPPAMVHVTMMVMVLMIVMAAGVAEPRPIVISLADSSKDCGAIRLKIHTLTCSDHRLEPVWRWEVSSNSSKAQDYRKQTHLQSDWLV